MLSTKRSTVPHYLRSGSFYQALCVEDDEEFEIPADCFKYECSVESERDLKSLFRTIRFWGVSDVPLDAFQFIAFKAGAEHHESVREEFPEFDSFVTRALNVKAAPPSNTVVVAIQEGFGLDAVRFLCWKNYDWSAECCKAAATVGDVECLMFLHTEGCPWDEQTTTSATQANQTLCLQYALDFGCPSVPQIMQIVAKEGHIEVLKVLRAAGVPWDKQTMTAAITGNKLECVRFLHAEGWTLGYRLCRVAAFYDAFECLQYLHEVGGLPLTGITLYAAQLGNLRCLVYAHEHGDTWDALCCAAAARGNHLACLQYAHEQGCDWDESTLIAAIGRGSWSCVKYALNHGCPRLIFMVFVVMLCLIIPSVVLNLFIRMRGPSFRIARIVSIVSPSFLMLAVYGREMKCFTPNRLKVCLWVYGLVVLPMVLYNLYGDIMNMIDYHK